MASCSPLNLQPERNLNKVTLLYNDRNVHIYEHTTVCRNMHTYIILCSLHINTTYNALSHINLYMLQMTYNAVTVLGPFNVGKVTVLG